MQTVFLNLFFFFSPDVQVKTLTCCQLDYCFGIRMRTLTKGSPGKGLHVPAMLSGQQVS